jgi:hypothetical protein
VEEPPQAHGQRLVVIVLAHQHDTAGAVARLDSGPVLRKAAERRLLDQHVLPRREGSQREVAVISRGHRDDYGVNSRILERRGVAGVRGLTAEPTSERLRLRAIATRVAADDLALERAQVTAVDSRDKAAAEKRQAQGHSDKTIIAGSGIRDRDPVGNRSEFMVCRCRFGVVATAASERAPPRTPAL